MPAPRLKEGVDSKYMTIEVWDQGEVSSPQPLTLNPKYMTIEVWDQGEVRVSVD
jgi:anti-sigma regulatory factor (Ser/Thr protein kinase)